MWKIQITDLHNKTITLPARYTNRKDAQNQVRWMNFERPIPGWCPGLRMSFKFARVVAA